MITKAKVSLSAVRKFDQAASECRDYSSRFDRGISCIEKLLNILSEMEKSIAEKKMDLQNAQSKLAIKIKNIEEIVSRLTAQLNRLKAEFSDFEAKLSAMNSSYIVTTKDGNEQEIPNPAYLAMEAKITSVEGEIRAVEAELYAHQQRLEKANMVDGEISSHIDELNSVNYSLSEKKSACKQLSIKLEDVKNGNEKKSVSAVENLKKIEQIVAAYIRIKMAYDDDASMSNSADQGRMSGVTINININRGMQPNDSTREPGPIMQEKQTYKEYIKEHHIKFDAENHIKQYDGKSFGGKYNSYVDRINGTPAYDNPILGRYEGARGESKYIPSVRSTEGIVVAKLLKQYGIDGIEYRNGEPDFEVCANAVVTITNMTQNRENYSDGSGEVCLGNFSQADIELAKAWNLNKKDGRTDWEPREVFNYRKANGLTWHEKCDTKTMVLVKTEINGYFKHIGGCSECRLRDAGISEGGFDE